MFKENLYIKALKKFAGEYVYTKIIEEGDNFLTVAGEVKQLTIVMLKIEGWPSLINNSSPREIIDFLNNYYFIMFNSIHENHGIVNNIINDQIIAIWGLTNKFQKNKEDLSCSASIECLRKFNETINNIHKNKLRLISGISSGSVVVGNFGSEERLFNCVMGDIVSFSYMLMEKNSVYKTNILIQESVKNNINEKIKTREIDTINFPGTDKPYKVFEII